MEDARRAIVCRVCREPLRLVLAADGRRVVAACDCPSRDRSLHRIEGEIESGALVVEPDDDE